MAVKTLSVSLDPQSVLELDMLHSKSDDESRSETVRRMIKLIASDPLLIDLITRPQLPYNFVYR